MEDSPDPLQARRAMRTLRADEARRQLLHARRTLERFRWARLRDQPGEMLEWIGEAYGRLEQLAWIVRRVEILQVEYDAGNPRVVGPELEILTEAFYYVAFRARRALRNLPFPALKGFNPAGVRDVRNHLIEHPESASAKGPFPASYAFGGIEGPRLRVARTTVQQGAPEDLGLYVNASEFATQLQSLLDAELPGADDDAS